ncbi:hypothetical protein [Microbacterium sp. No. 7]|uniref:hypothetical protein n=1 Tax=Microbacterium sp. No. 7 TaxID=1714373 RepID=UPI0006CF2084|nr:hypothetical protein [Microbacterium sp. No. 7]ALJ19033.1 hypothetical protein AOA12_03560 [Microbacterium sp. No. 7]
MNAENSAATAHPTARRRTVIKGAAWSLPVIAMAVATPASAATDPTTPKTTPGVDLFERSGGGGYGETKGLVTNSNYLDPNADGVFQTKLVLDKKPGHTTEPPSGTQSGLITYTISLNGYSFTSQDKWQLQGWSVVSNNGTTAVLTYPSIAMYGSTGQIQIPVYRTAGTGSITVTVGSTVAGSAGNVVPGSTY